MLILPSFVMRYLLHAYNIRKYLLLIQFYLSIQLMDKLSRIPRHTFFCKPYTTFFLYNIRLKSIDGQTHYYAKKYDFCQYQQ